ncbi:MAG: DUF4038 domain-containing protein [Verrucomicrobia bacterium]|nr:DUF4038 domain-containing protein [Verrucomicrobiota bacterium]MDA1068364.1 DUF4038 domain-containing protein [Verrucomicrobiota bacterium]
MNFRKIIVLALVLFSYGHVTAQSGPASASQWEVTEFKVTLPHSEMNPFDRHPLAKCEGPGSSFSVPGFYTGQNKYTFRISFPKPGNWVVLSPETGDRWQVAVATADSGSPGPVVIREENPQHFYYANGEPCFVLAFEADWLFALDLESDDIERTRILLRDIKDNGFNQIVMNVYAHDVNWVKDPKLPAKYDFSNPRQWPYGGDNDHPDYSKLNLGFFDHFDAIIEEMNALNLTAHVMIYVWNKNVNWPESDSVEDNRYYDYVIARYQAYPNIIWDISKEATGYGHNDMDYIVRRIQRLKKMDGHNRLVTVHSFSYCVKYPETVDFISYQNWTTSLYEQMLDTFQKFSNKPIFNIEHGGYEIGPYFVFDGDYDGAEACLDRNYRCAFAGTYSTYYWHDTSWNVIIWDQASLPESDRPRYDYYKHMAEFFNKVNYASYRPLDRRTDRKSSSGYVMTNDNGDFLFYLTAVNSRIATTIQENYGKTMSYQWFNTLTGEYSKKEEVIIEQHLRFEPPWKEQPAVLHLLKQ